MITNASSLFTSVDSQVRTRIFSSSEMPSYAISTQYTILIKTRLVLVSMFTLKDKLACTSQEIDQLILLNLLPLRTMSQLKDRKELRSQKLTRKETQSKWLQTAPKSKWTQLPTLLLQTPHLLSPTKPLKPTLQQPRNQPPKAQIL